MNKIYKVIWNKAKGCYAVVSEIARSHSKSGSGKQTHTLALAALLVTSALAGFFPVLPSYAYTAAQATNAQYTVFQTSDTDSSKPATYEFNGKSYTYNLQILTIPGSKKTVNVYVRNGYKASLVVDKRYTATATQGANPDAKFPEVSYKIMAYQTDATADTSGLLYTDSVNSKINTYTLTETGIRDINVNMYTGGVIGGLLTPDSWKYFIQDTDGTWVDGGTKGKSRFVEVEPDDTTGAYTYDDEELELSYLYVLKDTSDNNTYKVGVFLDDNDKVYRGLVYGGNNEILKTAIGDDGNIYSFWGAENDDPNVLIKDSGMTIGEFNHAMSDLVTNVRSVQSDDIQKVTAEGNTEGNGGTISLLRRGTYDQNTGKYSGELETKDTSYKAFAVDGALQLTSTGGTDGKDVALHIQQADSTGAYTDAFTLDAGSKVVALGDNGTAAAADSTIKKLQINGQSYNLIGASKVLAGTNVTVDTDADDEGVTTYTISATDTDTTYTAADDSVTIDANNHTIKANSSQIIKNATTEITDIAKGTDIHVKAETKAVGSDGTVSFSYEDGNGKAIDGKTLSITGIAKSDLSNITEAAKTEITNIAADAVKVVSGDQNVTVEPSTGTGVKTYTITAKDTTLDTTGSTSSTTADGQTTWTIKDTAGNVVTLDDLASYTTMNTRINNMSSEIKTVSGQLITGGSISDNGKITLKQNKTDEAGNPITFDLDGTLKDYSVTSGTYNSKDQKITLTKTNAYNATDTDTVDIDLSALETKMGDLTNITNKGETVIKNLAKGEDIHVKAETKAVGADGSVTFEYEDGNEKTIEGKTLSITGIASSTALTTLQTTVENNYTTLNNNAIKSGNIDESGNITLTKNDGNTIAVGTVSDYSVTEGAYNSEGKKITLTRTNAFGEGTDTVTIDLSALEKKITDATGATASATFGITAGEQTAKKNLNEAIEMEGQNGINVTADGETNKVTVSLSDNITIGTKGEKGEEGKEGKIGLAGQDGTNGKDGNVVEIRVQNGQDGEDGQKGAAGVDGADGITRIVYTDKTGDHQVATMEDGLKFQGDDATVISKKLNNTMEIKGGAAANTLTDNNIGVVSGTDGALHVKLANALTGINSITGNGTTISLTTDGVDVGGKKITGVKAGEADTDAVNVSQLKEAISEGTSTLTDKGFGLIGSTEGSVAATKKLGENVTLDGANGIVVSSTADKVTVSLSDNITIGTAGKDGAKGEQGHIGLAGKDGTDGKDSSTLVDIRVEKGEKSLDGKDGEDGITRIIYKDGQGDHQVATLDDGLKFQGDDETVISKKLNNTMEIKGGADATKLTDGNIGVVSDNGALHVKLANALTGINSITGNGTTISLTKDGLDVGSKKITGVLKGEADTDAVNVSQLKAAISEGTSTLTTKGFGLIGTTEGSVAATKKLGENVTVDGENGIVVSSTAEKVTVSLDSNITIGKDGKDGEQGHIGLVGKDGEDGTTLVDIRAEKGEPGLDGTDGITRIIYKEGDAEHQVATLDDGLKFAGDSGDTISKKLNETLTIKGGATGTLTDNNIGVVSDGSALTVKLASALTGITSISNNTTSITLNENNISVNKTRITNVEDGTDEKDAVNKGQLDSAKTELTEKITKLGDGAVMYDKTGDAVNYDKVTMGGGKGTAYNATDKTGGTVITNVAYAAGKDSADYDGSQVVNMDRLNDSIDDAISKGTEGATKKGFALIGSTEGSTAAQTKVQKELGEAIEIQGEKGIAVTSDGDKVHVSLDSNITIGTVGKDGAKGEQGHIGLAGKDGEDGTTLVDIRAEKGEPGLDGKDGFTRIIYKEGDAEHQVATLDDGLKFKGDDSTVISKKLNNTMEIKGGADATKLTDNNIGVVSGTDGALHVKLANELTHITSISNNNTTITLNSDNISVNNTRITNVEDGTDDKDAVNKGQLDSAKKELTEKITKLGDGAVMYDTKEDGSVNYDKVTMGGSKGTTYNATDKTGGTVITNVAYSDGTKSDAVNVQYLEDKISAAKTSIESKVTEVAGKEKHIAKGTYTVENSQVTMKLVDGDEKDTGETVVINDVAKASDVGTINGTAEQKHEAGKEDGILKDSLKNTTKDAEGNTIKSTVADALNKVDDKVGDVQYVDKKDSLTTDIINAQHAINEADEILADDTKTEAEKAAAQAKRDEGEKAKAIAEDLQNGDDTTTAIAKLDNKLENLSIDIDKARARPTTALTVNGGTEAGTDGTYSEGGNLLASVTYNKDDHEMSYDLKLADTVTLGSGENQVTMDGTAGTITAGTGENAVKLDGKSGTISAKTAQISESLTVGEVQISKKDLGTYTADTGDHKTGDALTGYTAGGLANTTVKYTAYADGSGKAATEEQLHEVIGAADFSGTHKDESGETVNNYHIVQGATNVTEAITKLDVNAAVANQQINTNTANISQIAGSLDRLGNRVKRVGAGAAALAALHPLDFDPDDKWDFAAGYGNYAGANAAAIGAYYRPNEDTMFTIGGSFGGGENMVNAGVSLKLGRGNHVTTSKVAMAKEIKELRATVKEQGEQIAQLVALVNQLTEGKIEVKKLPDPAETFTVDTVEEKDGTPTVERVRAVK